MKNSIKRILKLIKIIFKKKNIFFKFIKKYIVKVKRIIKIILLI